MKRKVISFRGFSFVQQLVFGYLKEEAGREKLEL
jgi:hypothetical protein